MALMGSQFNCQSRQSSTVAIKKRNFILRVIRQQIYHKFVLIITPLYNFMVWPHLEYSPPFWFPHLKRDIVELKKMDKR